MIEGLIQIRCSECAEMDSVETKGIDFEQFISGARFGLWTLVDTDWQLGPRVLCPECKLIALHDEEAERTRGDR